LKLEVGLKRRKGGCSTSFETEIGFEKKKGRVQYII